MEEVSKLDKLVKEKKIFYELLLLAEIAREEGELSQESLEQVKKHFQFLSDEVDKEALYIISVIEKINKS